ncbi:hypothetical protein [Arcobacter sp. L]|uniref:hypothetical protein n=1 Tax=Arcobacter sp. L TaxID=944547 RepID=UPI00067FE0C3|nr:hypothetical protein [Arcobacter sp. L]
MFNKIIPIIVICLFSLIFYAVFTKASHSAKSKRVECQIKTTTFEKIFVEEPIKEAIQAFKAGNYEINSSIEYSKYMKSHLIDILTKEQSDKILQNIINKYLIQNEQQIQDKKLSINYYIYENDKADSGKKNSEAKKYAGYLMFDFKYDKKLVYKIQIDYMDLDAKDLEDRMNCAINSFLLID